MSSPPLLLRLLPAGAFAGWDLHPLESAAFSRRTQTAAVAVLMSYSRLAPEGHRHRDNSAAGRDVTPSSRWHARKLDCFLLRELGKFFRASPDNYRESTAVEPTRASCAWVESERDSRISEI